ncbi:transposase, partial [Streptomyces halstedii]
MARPSRYPLELRRRAVRMVAEVHDDHPNETAALQAVTDKLGIGSRETLRNWVKQHEIDAGTRPGTTTEESAQLLELVTRSWSGLLEASVADEAAGEGDEGVVEFG